MRHKRYAKQLAGAFEPIGRFYVGLAWSHTSARMIMRHDNRGSAISNGIGEDLARVHQAGHQRTDGHHPLGDQTIRTIQRQTDEIFLLFITNIGQ